MFNSNRINITYGETPDLTNYKLYLDYSDSEIKPLDFSDEKLKVKYFYQPFNTDESEKKQIDKLPDKYIAGSYTIEYTFDTLTKFEEQAKVYIEVNQAERGAFKVLPTKNTWYTSEKTSNVTLATPTGLPVTDLGNSEEKLKTDDSNGNYMLYFIKKAVYVAFTDAQKTDYEYINNFFSADAQKPEREIWLYSPNDDSFPAGEYMLFAMIDKTYNYQKVVTPAVEIEIKEVFIGRTFTFQSLVLQDGSGNPVTDTDNEYVGMTENLNTENQGNTVICKENYEVRGTVDFGGGAFDDLTGDDVYMYVADGTSFSLINTNHIVLAEGELIGNTLTLKMDILGDGTLYWIFTFTCQ